MPKAYRLPFWQIIAICLHKKKKPLYERLPSDQPMWLAVAVLRVVDVAADFPQVGEHGLLAAGGVLMSGSVRTSLYNKLNPSVFALVTTDIERITAYQYPRHRINSDVKTYFSHILSLLCPSKNATITGSRPEKLPRTTRPSPFHSFLHINNLLSRRVSHLPSVTFFRRVITGVVRRITENPWRPLPPLLKYHVLYRKK